MTVINEDRNLTNIYAKEPIMTFDEKYTEDHNTKAERLNGRLAMIGFVAAIGAYILTGDIIPGIF